MLARRKFLKIMGVSTAAAPLAAKEVFEAENSRLTAMGSRLGGQMLAGSAPTGGPASDDPGGYTAQRAWLQLNGGKLPEHIEKMARNSAKNVAFLDHDIAAKRSWSMAAKIHEQRQRNYREQVEYLSDPNRFETAQRLFEKLTGFKWRIW